jgi:hypothetical protein
MRATILARRPQRGSVAESQLPARGALCRICNRQSTCNRQFNLQSAIQSAIGNLQSKSAIGNRQSTM